MVYADSFRGAFQFDDIPSLLENPTVRRLWPLSIPLSPPHGALTVSGRPVLNLSFALNYAVSEYGLWSYHALNLLIHVGAALALFGVVRRTLARRGAQDSRATALAVALVWAVHPLTTESVTYVVQRAESLMALFYLLTLYFFVLSEDEGRPGRRIVWTALSVVSCWLGMATKEVMVTAPVVALLYDRTFVSKGWTEAWRRRRGYYACLAGSWVMLAWLVASTGWDRGGTSGFHVGVSWVGYWATQGEAMFRYLGLSLWPSPLALDYGPATAPAAVACALCAIVLAAFSATVAGCAKGSTLGLSLGRMLPCPFADERDARRPSVCRRTPVLPTLGGRRDGSRARRPGRRFAVGPCGWDADACVILPNCCRCSRPGDGDGAPQPGLRRRAHALEGHGCKTAAERAGRGQPRQGPPRRGPHGRGRRLLPEGDRVDPGKPAARYNLGIAYEAQGRWDAALVEFIAAVDLNPKMVYADFRAGRLLDRLGRGGEAERFLRMALAIAPDLAEAHGSLGAALVLQGRREEAVAEFVRSLVLEPDQPEVEFDVGVCLQGLGRPGEAVPHFAAAVRLRPGYGDAQLNLGVALAQTGRFAEALGALHAAERLMPDSAQAHENAATVLEELGRTDEAVAEYKGALRLKPDYAEAHYNFGNALLSARDLAAARAEFAEALRLRPDFAAARRMLDRLAGLPHSR